MIKKEPLKTDLIGSKTDKTDYKIEFFGEVDELSATIMEFTHYTEDKILNLELENIVKTLFIISGEVAGSKNKLEPIALQNLLSIIDSYSKKTQAFHGFILPGKTLKGAKTHVLRTVSRRCERAYAKVYKNYGGSDIIFEYLNKLSTLFYLIAKSYDEN